MPRQTYADHFEDRLIDFYENLPPNSDLSAAAERFANIFRGDEWMILDDKPYARQTRQELLSLANPHNDPSFFEFIQNVFDEMEYNVRHEED